MAAKSIARKLLSALAVLALAFGAVSLSGAGVYQVVIADGGHQPGDYDPG